METHNGFTLSIDGVIMPEWFQFKREHLEETIQKHAHEFTGKVEIVPCMVTITKLPAAIK